MLTSSTEFKFIFVVEVDRGGPKSVFDFLICTPVHKHIPDTSFGSILFVGV